jgi:exopolysaccharide biosynthesis polyprenyl glycosylphosphotransferase
MASAGPSRRLSPGFAGRLNLAIDLFVLVGSLVAGVWLPGAHYQTETLWFSISAVAVWVVTATALRYYVFGDIIRSVLDDVALATLLVMAMATILVVASFAVPDGTPLPRLGKVLLFLWPTTALLRVVVFRRVATREIPQDEILIIGSSAVGRLTGEDLISRGQRHVQGFLRFAEDPVTASLPAPLLGTVADLEQLLRTTPVNEVYVAGNVAKHADQMQAAIKVCEKLGIPFALPAYSFRLERAQPRDKKAISDGFLHYQAHDAKPQQMAIKRLFDICSSAVALWMLLPLFAAVAVAIKLSSRGPVFFKQVRVGLFGKPFHMLKFRSMVTNAEELKAKLEKQNEMSGPVFKMKQDPRITGIGRFIRKYSIDELPQLINVLRGDMSIVGPRPPVPQEVAKYEPWQRRRLSVRPGLTCIWQVSGRNQISFEEWMYLDMQYIDHWSLGQDIGLIFKTVPIVITGRGAS